MVRLSTILQCTTFPYHGVVARSPKLSTTPAFVIPMAAESVTELPDGPDWLYELKLDGSFYSWTVSPF